jgi:hypothetical protein
MKFPPARRYLRYAAIIVVASLAALSLFVRIEQYRFRFRAERLHAEILALQLHPGNFADVQRLQREWGAHAHFDGPCTQHHCIYEITIEDVVDEWFRNPADAYPNFQAATPWLRKTYAFFGGHPAFALANVRVRDDRMWGADFSLGLWAYPGKGRNEGQEYDVLASTLSGSRLSDRNKPYWNAVRRGYRMESSLNCLGCEFVEVFLTAQTDPRDIRRFNQFNFSCITAIRTCKDPVDVVPDAWNQSLIEKPDGPYSEEQACGFQPAIVAREANDIVLAKLLSVSDAPSEPGPPNQWAKVQILKQLKNGPLLPVGSEATFYVPLAYLYPKTERVSEQLTVGGEYFFLHREHHPGEVIPNVELDPCHVLPNTPANAAAIQEGIALDPSAGEPYEFRNEPYTEN